MTPLIVIPARMASTRLPGKPLADIGGAPMIVRVCQRAAEAAIGPVLVAAAEPEIAAAVKTAGFEAILTDPNLPSGSDRVWAAAEAYDPDGYYDVIVNLQGDMPTIAPATLSDVLSPLEDEDCAIATLAGEITDPDERSDPNVVKAVLSFQTSKTVARALYFTRTPTPYGPGPLWHHIGLYAYRRPALERFVKAAPSALEIRERLEQLRALELGLSIGCAVINGPPPNGVDTPSDLDQARAYYATYKEDFE
ncbi:MAG: 3-deoxy-manno-octulosonate cytidylyltransferase [Pseudomonadota bacterium]